MNIETDAALEEEFTVRLLACEEALAAGKPPSGVADDASPEMRTRLLRGLECMQRLQQLRPQARMGGAVEAEGAWPACIGRFEIRGPIGQGGFGIVYRAYDPVLCREVALKIPRAYALADAECQARFQREARAAAGLDHPNLVPVHEAGQIGPISYIAFAYCPGSDLATWLKKRTAPVRCTEAACLVQTLARAIHYAHERGILHRDLKPSNVLLSPVAAGTTAPLPNRWTPDADSALIPRVTDFGLAKLTAGDQSQTQSGDLLGTPSYMAPEQVEGRLATVGPATDVYALGAVLYEVVTGRPPFWAETTVATLRQVETMEPVRPSRLRPELPSDLETICLKCLHKEPRKRYESAQALADDLDRFLTGKPIHARPTTRLEQAFKWARRHPALAASFGALALVTLVAAGVILDQWLQTQHALGVAVMREEQAQEAREKTEVALYHHGVVLAHHEWLAGNVGRATALLDTSRTDLRNWEWRYIRRLCDSSEFTCAGHSAQVTSVAYSPDGRYLASAAGKWTSSERAEVILWDAATGESLWTGRGHTGPVMSVAFSPDGRRIASASTTWGGKSDQVILWETATGKMLKCIEVIPSGIFCVTFSPDGTQLATAGADGKVRLWDAESGQALFVLDKHKANVFGVAFSPDGQKLASADRNGVAFIWDLASRKEIHKLLGPVDLRSVAFSPEGQWLVAASFDHSVKIWEVASGQPLLTYRGHRAPALCAVFAPDGRRIASTDSAGVVHVWDAATGQIFRTIRGHTGSVASAAFSPDGRRLASGGREQTVRVWDITREQDVYSLPQASGALNVVFSPKGSYLAASGFLYSDGAREKRVRIWHMENPTLPRFWGGHTGYLRCVAFSHDEKLLASGSEDKTARIWDVATERTVGKLIGHSAIVTGVCFHPEGVRVATSSLDKTVRFWDIATAKEIAPALTLPQPVYDVVFSPDGKRLVAAGDSGMVLVLDGTSGKLLHALPGHDGAVERVVFSPQCHRLATAGFDRVIRIWDMTRDLADGEIAVPLRELAGHTDRVVGLCFSPDGRRLASTGGDQTIRLWDVDSGQDALTLRGHPDSIRGVAFSPDPKARLLVSASSREIKVWDAGDGKSPITPLRAERDARLWHEQEELASRCATPPQWFGVAFHLSRMLDKQPDNGQLLASRAHAELELGQWRKAADDATRSIALGATNYSVFFDQAMAFLHAGDEAAYRRACASLLDRFGSEPGRGNDRAWIGQANDTAWLCVLTQGAVADSDRVVRLAESAVAAMPTSGSLRNTLGAALYRAGRFRAAYEMLRQQQDDPEDWLFLAMVEYRLGRAALARRWFDKVTHWRNDAKRDARAAGAIGKSQLAQIALLYREAASLLAVSGQAAIE